MHPSVASLLSSLVSTFSPKLTSSARSPKKAHLQSLGTFLVRRYHIAVLPPLEVAAVAGTRFVASLLSGLYMRVPPDSRPVVTISMHRLYVCLCYTVLLNL